MNDLETMYESYMTILAAAAGTQAPSNTTIEQMREKCEILFDMLNKLAKKHLSDSPNFYDKQKLSIDIFELALKLAKGEIKV